MWNSIFENLLIMILTIVFLLGGGYLFLAILGLGLRLKSKNREQAGLTDLWIESQKQDNSYDQGNKGADNRR